MLITKDFSSLGSPLSDFLPRAMILSVSLEEKSYELGLRFGAEFNELYIYICIYVVTQLGFVASASIVLPKFGQRLTAIHLGTLSNI